jgi:sialate O-acetylesterase
MNKNFKNAWPVLFLLLTLAPSLRAAEQLKVHGIFRSNMVLQRDKAITIWGWAAAGEDVKVSLGRLSSTTKAAGAKGRWRVVFEAQAANAASQDLVVKTGDAVIHLENILIGDVWVMNGQSNMAFGLKAVYQNHFESSMAHLPLLRHLRINSGAESENLEEDLADQFINGKSTDKNWSVVTPGIAMEMGAIGYVFGSRLQRCLQIPIGIIDNARGGASLESLVPRHKFSEHPMAAEYLKWVEKRQSEFSEEAFLAAELDKWKVADAKWTKAVEADRAKGVKRRRRKPRKPDGSIRTWSVPGRSPSDAAACYNGMFGVFKGLNIKGVAFHQGYNNAMKNTSCKPRFYRVLMKLMVEGWREDFNDPELPVAVIGFCAGGKAQTRLNFEEQGFSTAAYIREAQRLGLADLKDPEHTAFIPSYDQKIPQLHTKKKQALGLRTARWALKTVYGYENISWQAARLLSAVPEGNEMLLTFDTAVLPDDMGSELEGFSIADKSGRYYLARAVARSVKDKQQRNKQILVSSPLVQVPVSVRYAWARSPMGNLKVEGKPWQPLHNFRTDQWGFSAEVRHSDPEARKLNSDAINEMKKQAQADLALRLESETR